MLYIEYLGGQRVEVNGEKGKNEMKWPERKYIR
jgi:hypothetical protein